MNQRLTALPGALPFFLQTELGERFCLYHAPDPAMPARGAMLYVHPFAEELNKTRRMAALQARAFAASGYAVLQFDLYGCGDSTADFADARWAIWKHDLALAGAWLEREVGGTLTVWGLRLGALLALEFARATPLQLAALVFWQPVLHGRTYLNQFLRMRIAGQMLSDEAIAGNGGTEGLRQEMRRGLSLEIGGYCLAPELGLEIDLLDGTKGAPPPCPLHWFELVLPATGELAAATVRQADAWRTAGARLQLHPVRGLPFWSTPEITVCQAMLAATATVCAAHTV